MRTPRSLDSLMRRHAFTAWRGPEVLFLDDKDAGRNVLRLAVYQHIMAPVLESRIVYDRLFDAESERLPYALLRAVSWDRSVARQASAKQGEARDLKMPARYVRIPHEQVHQWLQAFEGTPLFWGAFRDTTGLAPIYTLRIQYDEVFSVLERIWQQSTEGVFEQCWRNVWQEMSALLDAAPVVGPIREQFWNEEALPPHMYDFQGYQSTLFSFATQECPGEHHTEERSQR
jgi:hypothetical protein